MNLGKGIGIVLGTGAFNGAGFALFGASPGIGAALGGLTAMGYNAWDPEKDGLLAYTGFFAQSIITSGSLLLIQSTYNGTMFSNFSNFFFRNVIVITTASLAVSLIAAKALDCIFEWSQSAGRRK